MTPADPSAALRRLAAAPTDPTAPPVDDALIRAFAARVLPPDVAAAVARFLARSREWRDRYAAVVREPADAAPAEPLVVSMPAPGEDGMVPFADCDPTLADIAAALAAVGIAAAVEPDPDPLPAAWAGGRSRVVVGAGGPVVLPGVVVVVRTDLPPWDFFDRHHAAAAAAVGRVLPLGWTWRLLLDPGRPDGRRVAPARAGRVRVGDAVPRPPTEDRPMEARADTPDLFDDVLAAVRRISGAVFGVGEAEPGWPRFAAELRAAFAALPYRSGEVLGDDLRRMALQIAALSRQVYGERRRGMTGNQTSP